MGYSRVGESNQPSTSTRTKNPHYENIYESIDQYAAGNAAPAEHPAHNPHNNHRVLHVHRGLAAANARSHAYRNELYDRTASYDIPRQAMRVATAPPSRRSNLHLDLNPTRRYGSTNRTAHRQRSFDDTESHHYVAAAINPNAVRYENIYEQIRENPSSLRNPAAGRMYGHLDVIGHGVGRIERHLSSSCGNIDHYNLGGHYAVLGHSHLGTVGHIRLNPATARNNGKETAGKSLNLFSCLGRENSQSMSNISAASDTSSGNVKPNPPENPNARATGAIPKAKNKVAPKAASPPAMHSGTFNRIPKSSLQWMLVNKWLPLWMGEGPDCSVVDFNFMFSRNCEGCTDIDPRANIMRFNSGQLDGRAEYRSAPPQRRYIPMEGSLRPLQASTWSRVRDGERSYMRRDGSLDERMRAGRANYENLRSLSNDHAEVRNGFANPPNRTDYSVDPFRNWELNSENNSFRPAVRRITDGTFPSRQIPDVRIEVSQPSTSTASQEPVSKEASPEMNHRRCSDNTEDDQDAVSQDDDSWMAPSDADGNDNEPMEADAASLVEAKLSPAK